MAIDRAGSSDGDDRADQQVTVTGQQEVQQRGQADVPVTPIQAQGTAVGWLVEKYPSDPAPRPEQVRR
jgi:hypothetical protein